MKTLQGFKKTNMSPNEMVEVEIVLNSRSFSSWNIEKEDWEIRPGLYQIMIGSSSNKILLQDEINL